VNQTNDKGIYGFHPGGANVAFADGSVRFLTDSTSPVVLTAMATRADGDAVTME
jgi:prepilin-type processing-associated H-X9-DG protein